MSLRSAAQRRIAVLVVSAGLAVLAACSSDRPKPTPLETYPPKLTVSALWNSSIGSIAFPMIPAVSATANGSVVVVASGDDLTALQVDTGNVVWRASTGTAISAGVGSDGRYASVVTRGNEVVTFDAGREVWRKRVPSAVVTPPLVAGERVFVMSVDRAVHAFDAADGRRLWVLQRPGDALTLSQASVVSPFKNNLLVGQGQRLAAIDPLRGTVQWEVPMASPRGSNEVERLADLIGPVLRVGDRVCARAFQSAVACADATRGSVLWTRNVGGVQAVGGNADHVFGADASDRIAAWRADNGEVAWTSEKLLHRSLSGAVAVGNSVVFGDGDGYVHFLAAASGEQQLRLQTNGKAVLGAPVLVNAANGATLLVITQNGGVFAFRPS